jgi:DNA-binding NtrC family response regulator
MRDSRLENPAVIVGASPAMHALRVEIESAARTNAKVLLLGETGTGKELVAQLLHVSGPRRQRRYVTLNCSGIPDTLLESELFGHTRGSFTGAFRDKVGLAELADGGTLLLDECGEMTPRMQGLLLRFLETGEMQPVGATTLKKVDVRLIASTHRDLRAAVRAQQFREDLYYRLNVIQLVVPPLRDRREDVLPLMEHFLRLAGAAHGVTCPRLTASASEALVAYSWPGNVRELRNVAERLVARQLGDQIALAHLPAEIQSSGAPAPPLVLTMPQAAAAPVPDRLIEDVWARLRGGESFWTTVHALFKTHDLTRDDLRAIVHRALEESRGNYRRVVEMFNMPPADYRRFLSFLYQYDCNVAFQAYRARPRKPESGDEDEVAVPPAAVRHPAASSGADEVSH